MKSVSSGISSLFKGTKATDWLSTAAQVGSAAVGAYGTMKGATTEDVELPSLPSVTSPDVLAKQATTEVADKRRRLLLASRAESKPRSMFTPINVSKIRTV